MTRNYPVNLALQPIKGIFVFKDGDDILARGLELMKTLHCEVLSSHSSRVTVKTSRGNLQSIKKNWLSQAQSNTLGKELSACILQIVIGGKA